VAFADEQRNFGPTKRSQIGVFSSGVFSTLDSPGIGESLIKKLASRLEDDSLLYGSLDSVVFTQAKPSKPGKKTTAAMEE